jgi:hypothetical protein
MRPAAKSPRKRRKHYVTLAPGVGGAFPGPAPSADAIAGAAVTPGPSP